MALLVNAPKGTVDVFPPESRAWQMLESVLSSEAQLNAFHEVRTPVFEHTELFLRGVGDTTDVVEKQMYTFMDKGDRSITLRPEGTAGVVRAMLGSGIYNQGLPLKFYYISTCYRYEKPQKGRLRELHQFGVELFGTAEPSADVQVISMAMSAFARLALKDVALEINSIGCKTCRAGYHDALRAYFSAYTDKLCPTCLGRLERNPMRILDCKSPECGAIASNAPIISDHLCECCDTHFDAVQKGLTVLNVPYTLNPRLVRGLDYYTRTVFEFISKDIGAQSAIGGGGRYDGLVEELGGKPTPALGFGLGLDRIMLLMEAQGIVFEQQPVCEVFIAAIGEKALEKALILTNALHACGVSADFELCNRGLKAQMKYADRIRARYSIVLGEAEIERNQAKLKNMQTGEMTELSIGDDFIENYIAASISEM